MSVVRQRDIHNELHPWKALAQALSAGSVKALARCLSLCEEDAAAFGELARYLPSDMEAPKTWVIGITGPAGVGKSSLIAGLISQALGTVGKVGVLAVDPSSPRSGGAFLGDRIRLLSHGQDARVFVRSLSSRGYAGGLAEAVQPMLETMAVAGFPIIFLESLGVGQGDTEITNLAQTTVLVLGADSGDDIQAQKAGVLEMADVFAVNKSDREASNHTFRHLQQMLEIGHALEGDDNSWWTPPVLRISATQGTGLSELWTALLEHRAFLETHQTPRMRYGQDKTSTLFWRAVGASVETWARNTLGEEASPYLERLAGRQDSAITLARAFAAQHIIPRLESRPQDSMPENDAD